MSIRNSQQLLQTLTERLTDAATVKKVYGDPVVTQDKTIIPVARVTMGFGGGFGGGGTQKGESDSKADDVQGEGGGLGGGLMVQPIGYIEVTPQGTRYRRLGVGRYVALGIAAGFVLSSLLGRRRG